MISNICKYLNLYLHLYLGDILTLTHVITVVWCLLASRLFEYSLLRNIHLKTNLEWNRSEIKYLKNIS